MAIAGAFWENLSADSVLFNIFQKLREDGYFRRISHSVHDEAARAWETRDLSNPPPDEDFVSAFVANKPELFNELKETISEIFSGASQFVPCRNPDFREFGS
jgi:hypothetical protein